MCCSGATPTLSAKPTELPAPPTQPRAGAPPCGRSRPAASSRERRSRIVGRERRFTGFHLRSKPTARASAGKLRGVEAARDEPRIRRLLDIGRTLTTELDEGVVLDLVLETARDITGARYAALGVLNEQHTELQRFLTAGVDEATHRAIGDLPRGRGVLGALIEDPRPLRMADVGQHPSSYGFPAGHPVMRSFLGVPVVIRGQVWGNLYLTEKAEGEFSEARRGGRGDPRASGRRSRSATPGCMRPASAAGERSRRRSAASRRPATWRLRSAGRSGSSTCSS